MNEKSVLVTGAAGDIGKAVIKKFCSEGWKVFAADIENINDDNVSFLKFNPDNAKTAAPAVIDAISETGYAVDAVVCAHRETGRTVSSPELPLEEWEKLLRRNVFSYYMISRCAAKAMISSKKQGSIVFIGDICYKGAVPGKCAYTSSMGAVHSMTKGLALDFAPHGIRVNCILPGPVATIDNFVQSKYIPTGTITTPEQIASTAYFFAGDQSCNTTGASLAVDGGMDCLVPGAF